jgi:hypothetical protein
MTRSVLSETLDADGKGKAEEISRAACSFNRIVSKKKQPNAKVVSSEKS